MTIFYSRVFNDVFCFVFPAKSVKFLDCTDKLAEKDSGRGGAYFTFMGMKKG